MERENRQALDRLFTLAYEELRRLAFAVKRNDGSLTITPTALVNEAWLKLARSPQLPDTSPLHFKRIAARAMRQVLIDLARHRATDKRGGSSGTIHAIAFDDEASSFCTSETFLELEESLQELERIEPRQALVVESRFFGGFDVAETAELLGISESTVAREWRVARAWLKYKLSQPGNSASGT